MAKGLRPLAAKRDRGDAARAGGVDESVDRREIAQKGASWSHPGAVAVRSSSEVVALDPRLRPRGLAGVLVVVDIADLGSGRAGVHVDTDCGAGAPAADRRGWHGRGRQIGQLDLATPFELGEQVLVGGFEHFGVALVAG